MWYSNLARLLSAIVSPEGFFAFDFFAMARIVQHGPKFGRVLPEKAMAFFGFVADCLGCGWRVFMERLKIWRFYHSWL